MARRQFGRRLDSQPWPPETMASVNDINKLLLSLGGLMWLIVDQGLNKRDFSLVNIIRPEIYDVAAKISLACEELMLHLPDKRKGRIPNWYKAANELYDLALDMAYRSNDLANYLKTDRRFNAGFALGLMNKTYAEMIDAMESIRKPHQSRPSIIGLEIWPEAIEQAIDE